MIDLAVAGSTSAIPYVKETVMAFRPEAVGYRDLLAADTRTTGQVTKTPDRE
jgi:hypothetical protein